MSPDESKNDQSTFQERVALEKQKFWDLEAKNSRQAADKATTSHGNIHSSSRNQHISLFLVSFICSIAISAYILFYIVGGM